MDEFTIQIIVNTIPFFLLIIAVFTGKAVEKRHLRSILRRETEMSHILFSDVKRFPHGWDPSRSASMVVGEAVIATDYLKSFCAKWRKILGGELKSFNSLMTRARKEAILRMGQEAQNQGYNAVCNVRIEFADIGGIIARGTVTVAVIASGTAYSIPAGT
jgi:uncharacterized protein YbjQ (UPF0145 family)